MIPGTGHIKENRQYALSEVDNDENLLYCLINQAEMQKRVVKTHAVE